MKRSVNEIRGMVLKAARGAGVPLGHAEDLSAAAGFLALDKGGLDALVLVLAGPHVVVSLVENTDELVINDARAIMAGPVALDAVQAGIGRAVLRGLDALQVVQALVACHGNLRIEVQDGAAVVWPDEHGQIARVDGPIEVDPAVWKALERYAHKTYVPASDASRLAGAGAGLTDND